MDTFNIIREAHKGFSYLILVAALVFIVALLMAMFGYSGKISKLLKNLPFYHDFVSPTILNRDCYACFFPGLKSSIR